MLFLDLIQFYCHYTVTESHLASNRTLAESRLCGPVGPWARGCVGGCSYLRCSRSSAAPAPPLLLLRYRSSLKEKMSSSDRSSERNRVRTLASRTRAAGVRRSPAGTRRPNTEAEALASGNREQKPTDTGDARRQKEQKHPKQEVEGPLSC